MITSFSTTRKQPIIKIEREKSSTLVATILFHPELERIGARALLPELHHCGKLTISRTEPFFEDISQSKNNARPLEDPYLSRKPLQLEIKNNEICFTPPPSDFFIKINSVRISSDYSTPIPGPTDSICLNFANRIVVAIHWSKCLSNENIQEMKLIGQSDSIVQVRTKIAQVAPIDINVLVQGETGTGKEVVATALHERSSRSQEQLVILNMAAIPESLVSSELFGSVKGAFSGATKNKQGYAQLANKSSLFLDEIGETPMDVQAPLLRMLDCNEVQPVGGKPETVDVRYIAATDADLEQLIVDKKFTRALQQRLSGITIRLPPLRERYEDLGLLCRHLMAVESEKTNLPNPMNSASKDVHVCQGLATAIEYACTYNWPGNIRELKNWLKCLLIENRSSVHFKLPEFSLETKSFKQSDSKPKASTQISLSNKRKPKDIKFDELHRVLRQHCWELSAAATTLGISRAALYKMIDAIPTLRRSRDITTTELREAWKTSSGDLVKMVDILQISASALKRRISEERLSLDKGVDFA